MPLIKVESTSSRTNKKKFLTLFLFIVFIILPTIGWIFYKNQILLYWNNDNHSNIKKHYLTLINYIKTSEKVDINQSEFQNFFEILQAAIDKNPNDGRYYYMKGDIYLELIKKKYINPQTIHSIIMQSVHPTKIKKAWTKALIPHALISFRKSMYFTMPREEKEHLYENLAFLYFLLGSNYMRSGLNYTKFLSENSLIKNLYRINDNGNPIRWEIIDNHFPSEYANIWKAVYYLNQKSYPFAYNRLKNIISRGKNEFIRNEAHYLMYRLMKDNNNYNLMIYHLQKIDLNTYLNIYPNFISEYATTMRYYGYYQKANEAIRRFEKIHKE